MFVSPFASKSCNTTTAVTPMLRKTGLICALALGVAACQQSTPQERQERRDAFAADQAEIAKFFVNTVEPTAPQVGAFCLARAEGTAIEPTQLLASGYTQTSTRPPIYNIVTKVGSTIGGTSVIARAKGCEVILPNNGTVRITTYLAKLESAFTANGYTIGAGAAGRVATKGETRVSIRTSFSGGNAYVVIRAL